MEIEILKQEYDSIRSIAQRLANSITDQIRELVSTQCIRLAVPLECRVKEWGSIQDKIERNHLGIEAITELSDLIGIRIMLLFQRDLSRMCSAITNTFLIVSQEDTSERLDEAQFGYRSLHYNFKLPEAWLTMPTYRNCARFIIEAQIRTLAQHIWAAASHELQYKQEHNVPPPVRRSIHRVSALLETVDLEFERVLQERDSYVAEVMPISVKEKLNVDLLAKILSSKLPPQNMSSDEQYSELLSELSALGIETSDSLLKIIDKHLEKALAEDVSTVAKRREENSCTGTSQERMDKGVYFTHIGLIRIVIGEEFGDKWREKKVKSGKTRSAGK